MACSTVDAPEDTGTSIIRQEISYTSLGSSMGSNVTSGDTCGAANEVTPSCSAGSVASDLSYAWTAPNTGKYTFTATGSRTTPVLVLGNGATQAQIGCGSTGTITYSLSAGQKVLVTVDGAGSSCGSFTLGIQYAVCGTCNSPPTSGCYEPLGQCVYGVCKYNKACDASEVCQSNQCIPRCLIDPSYPC
jgi:hypothetical protein